MKESGKNTSIDWVFYTSEKIENIFVVKVIRNGLVTMIPILMIGAFALVFMTFPVKVYQTFITNAANGCLYSFFNIIYQATFGVMSIYMALYFSVSFFTMKNPEQPVNMWGVGSAIASFMIMIGVWSDSFALSDLGASSVFLAIATSLISSEIFYIISIRFTYFKNLYTYGADSGLGSCMGALMPAAASVAVAAVLAYIVTLSGYPTMHELVINTFNAAFDLMNNLFVKGLCFIFISSVLWLFGIHGSDVLEGVVNQVFEPLLDANILAAAGGSAPKEILCKPFFDCFILMGGCGSSICLFLAIILFSKNKGMRTIAKSASIPLLFNINELLVFGLPIVFNPVIAIPFLTVPVLQYLITYGAIVYGLVPHIENAVEWTTPVLISGYVSTGSIRGSILQIVNILIGVALYAPFVKIMERIKAEREETNREAFVRWYQANENRMPQVKLLALQGIYGDIAKRMALELKEAIKKEDFSLFYQPQYNYEGRCIGVESLLRWPAIEWLNVYPPLLLQLAREQGILLEMEKRILHRALSEREKVFRQFGRGIKISVNVTGTMAQNPAYWDYVESQWKKDPFEEGTLCIEVTEQDAVIFDEAVIARFRECKILGIKFAIDDFSAGQTSMEYLKNGIFDLLKLDGSLVRVINDNPRCLGIISSLVVLSESLDIQCLAEYVENEQIRETLHKIGCNLYQGYFYSPAVPLKNDEMKM